MVGEVNTTECAACPDNCAYCYMGNESVMCYSCQYGFKNYNGMCVPNEWCPEG